MNITQPILTTFLSWVSGFEDYLPLFFELAIGLAVLWLVYYLLRIYFQILEAKLPQTIFEVQPLRTTEKNPYTTQQLFAVIHELARQQNKWKRWLRVYKAYSLEIVSTRKTGISYLIRVDRKDAVIIKKSLLAYLPGLKIEERKDYEVAETKCEIVEFKLSNRFIFPLRSQTKLEKHDPIAYLTGSMTKLADDEMVVFQMVVSPVRKKLGARELNVAGQQSLGWLRLVAQVLFLPLGLVIFLLTDGKEGPMWRWVKVRKTGDSQELENMVKEKIRQPLFNTSLRLMVVSKNRGDKQRGFGSALSSFANSGVQAIITKKMWFKRLSFYLFRHRLQSLNSRLILSISEVSDLYHFPFARTTKTEDLLKQQSKELPAPLCLKQTEGLDVVFANNTYGGDITPIGLTLEERRRHMYILGATGTGKTTMLLSIINQDITKGKGLAVVDPHGDLIEDVLALIPKKRLDDVVYFNPDDITYPMGINLLEFTKGLSVEDSLREKEFITESIISLFHKIYAERYSGPRMEYILRNTIYTAYTVPGATLFTVYKLLINTPFRKSLVNKLKDENLKDFWRYEFAKAGDYQKVSMIGPITNKIGRFLFSPSAKRILEQEKSTIDFCDIMDNKKILLCNLSKGKIGEDTSEVLGVVIMAKLQLAALKRARVKMADRTDFFLYVDEFQNFATPSFAQILSEARKYRLSAILAHQTTSQLQDKSLVNVTLANTGTVVCFRTANPEDEKMILPQFRPYVEKGEIASLPSFRFYMKLGALNPQEPFSGITTPVAVKPSSILVEKIIAASRKNYAVKYKKKDEPKTIKPLIKAGLDLLP